MFSRALLVALCIVYATSLTPLAPLTAQADDDCALYLTGPGRSSAYDYSLNLLKGNFAYDGQHTCITYEAINQAYLDARNRILVSHPKGDWKAEDFASVGELILDISISLARTYGLTYEEIEKGLPLIDTSRTLIREVCPPVFSHVECRAGKYRRLDGLCNNLKHPTWGATMAPFQRLIGPLFSDGINAPRISHSGHDLPLSRVVSRTMHPDDGFHDHAGTVMVIAWGQFMDHDYTLTGTPLDPVHRNDPEECCKRPLHLKHPYCNEILVPDDDYFYRLFGVKCIDFVRGFPSPRPGCRLGSRIPFNTLTGAIDGNTVYGVTEKFARKLRTGYGGFLRMNPVFKEYGLKDLLPLKLDIPDEGCTRPNKNMYCFEAGEIRVNEQLVLTVMHTLMAREHNRVAEALAHVNPHWDDETLYQEARRINIAEIQHITYNEFLPILLGKDVMEKFGLVLAKKGYWDGYDEAVNPDVIASFAAAAYRFGHSLLPTAVERWSKAHKFIASKRLSDLIRRPYDLYRAGVLDEYVMGLMNQVAQAMDDSITQEVTNHLFKKVGARFGMDLVSFNMQRGREFGLPGYMEFRKFCGLSGADTFQDLFGSMPNETIRKYESIFEHPVDVDLWSGGVSERPLPGSMLGPTFACIIATQFSYSRRGDRFWFELPNQPSSFTPEQLVEIRKSRLARIICDNTDIIDTVQLYPMVLPDHELNPRVPCRSGIIPSMDFSKWADPVPFLGGAKEYMTHAYKSNGTNLINNQTDKICSISNENCISESTNFLNNRDKSNRTILAKDKEWEYLSLHPENNTECLKNGNQKNCKVHLCVHCSVVKNGNQNFMNKISKPNEGVVKHTKEKAASKYHPKKGDDIKASEKLKGYFKNSLRRKKRSFIRNIEDNSNTNVPGIYDVIKAQNIERGELNLPKLDPREIIKTSDIADFNIETVHKRDKHDNNKLQRGEQRFHNPLNNNQHFYNSKEDEVTNNRNLSHQGDKHGTFIEDENSHENQRGQSQTQTHKHGYLDNNNRKHAQESDEINIRENKNHENSSNEDDYDDKSNENYQRGERIDQNIKTSNHILPIGNLRYYKERKNKYHISKPKKLNDESSEDAPHEKINENSSSLEEDGRNHDEQFKEDKILDVNRKQPINIFKNQKQEYHNDNTKHTDKDNFSYQEDENDEELDENLYGHKQLTKNNSLRQNDRYYNNYKSHIPTSQNNNDYSKERNKGEDILNEYEDEEESGKSLENIKKDRQTTDDILERHNQKYNEKRNKYFLSGLKNLDEEDDENNEKEVDESDNDSEENLKNDRDIHEHKQRPTNILQKPNQHYSNDKTNKYQLPGSAKLVKHNDEKKGAYKENEDNDDDDDDRSYFIQNERLADENNQPNKLLKTQNQIYNKDNDKIYPSQESKKSNEESSEKYEGKGNSRENVYNENNEESDNNYNRHAGLLTITEETPPQSYKFTDSKKVRSEENNSGLKYAHQPILFYDRNAGRSNSFVKPNINGEIQLLSTNNKAGNTNNFNEKSKENFSDYSQKEIPLIINNNEKSPKIQKTYGKPKAIQEVDLSDFSYDRFRDVSAVDKLENAKDSRENYESDSLATTTSTSRPKTKKRLRSKNAKIKTPNKFSKQIHINRNKPKPVIELNNENSSEESQKNSNENLSSNFGIALLNRKSNVKQQFERKPSHNHNSNGSKNTGENIEFEGTLDTLSPLNNKYDVNLKKHFGDVSIKLPKIKLPEDILAYAQEAQENSKDKSKNYDFNYNNDDNAQYLKKSKPQGSPENVYHHYVPTDTAQYSEQPKPKGDQPAGEYDFFAAYINKPHEESSADHASSNSDIEDGEDLYERFVRERFGRKDYLKERSEKLKEKKPQENKPVTKNKELFENIQKAIKKAEQVQKEAEKSKDPNASYLWTLEYGEKL